MNLSDSRHKKALMLGRAEIPWNKEPNRCPCTNWENCSRNYEIIEYDDSGTPWKELNLVSVLTVSAKGIKWHI
jgi:hypothetical protein